MCADPATREAIRALREDIDEAKDRLTRLEAQINGDGSKEKGVIPRLSAIETKTNLIIGILGAIGGAVIPAVVKYLLK